MQTMAKAVEKRNFCLGTTRHQQLEVRHLPIHWIMLLSQTGSVGLGEYTRLSVSIVYGGGGDFYLCCRCECINYGRVLFYSGLWSASD